MQCPKCGRFMALESALLSELDPPIHYWVCANENTHHLLSFPAPEYDDLSWGCRVPPPNPAPPAGDAQDERR